MSDFQKAKVGFALALLGTVFALHPVLSQYASSGFEFLAVTWTIGRVYTSFSALLGGAVYIFAIDFAIHRPLPWVQAVGNLLYVVALAIVPAYGMLFLGHVLIDLALNLMKSDTFRTALQGGVFGIVGFLTGVAVKAVRNRLAKSERSSEANQYDKQEFGYIERATQLQSSGYSDMAILEAFRALEVALRAAYLRSGKNPTARTNVGALVRWAIEEKVLPASFEGRVDEIRSARNQIAYGEGDVSKEDADRLLLEAKNVLSTISRFEERVSETGRAGDDAQQVA